MSFQDRLASQDATQLLLAGSSLGLVAAALHSGTSYNFPLMLFGIVAHEMHSSTMPFRQFLTLTLVSAIFDLIYILSHRLFSLDGLVNLLSLLLKAPIFFTCLSQLRERGGELTFAPPNLGSFQGLPNSQNWSMPGGFGGSGPGNPNTSSGPHHASSGSGPAAPPPPPAGSFPSSGGFRLGGEDEDGDDNTGTSGEGHSKSSQGGPPGGPPGPAPGRNGYQSIA